MHENGASGLSFQKDRVRVVDRFVTRPWKMPLSVWSKRPVKVGIRNYFQAAVCGIRVVQIEENRNRIRTGKGIVGKILVPFNHGTDLGWFHVNFAVMKKNVRPHQLLGHIEKLFVDSESDWNRG